MGLVLGQSWMILLIKGHILFCPPIIMYCEICCCLHIHSVVNVLVMGLVLGQRLMLISSTGILLYAKVCPLYNVLWEFIVVVYMLTAFEHMSTLLAVKAKVFVKFHTHIY